MTLTVGSLFAGIGGFDLGLERAGMRTVWFCEQDPFCQRVLAKHWPGVPCHPDVRALVADAESVGQRESQDVEARSNGIAGPAGQRSPLPVSVPYVDVLCGGFPCQDLSYAGRGAGIEGSRSGLWGEFARLIGELRPRYVLVENVPALTTRGFDRVLADLAACGFDAEWDHLPASAFGAPHRRDRIWIVAYPSRDGAGQSASAGSVGERAGAGGQPSGTGDVADTDEQGEHRGGSRNRRRNESPHGGDGRGVWPDDQASGWWESEPDVGRVANGIPNRVDRLRALGNSLVPQIAEWIGRRIVEYESRP